MIKFRLYPENRSVYFTVRIYPDRKRMRATLVDAKFYAKQKSNSVRACVISLFRTRCYGFIFFNLQDFTDSGVAHELQHAVFAFAERKKILADPLFYLRSPETGKKLEEKLAEVAGELAWQFRWKCKQKKIEIK